MELSKNEFIREVDGKRIYVYHDEYGSCCTVLPSTNRKRATKIDETTPEYKLLKEVQKYFPKDVIAQLKTDADKKKWLDTIRLLHTEDNESYSDIKRVIVHGRTNKFWKTNFLSIAALRNKKDGVMKYYTIKNQMGISSSENKDYGWEKN